MDNQATKIKHALIRGLDGLNLRLDLEMDHEPEFVGVTVVEPIHRRDTTVDYLMVELRKLGFCVGPEDALMEGASPFNFVFEAWYGHDEFELIVKPFINIADHTEESAEQIGKDVKEKMDQLKEQIQKVMINFENSLSS